MYQPYPADGAEPAAQAPERPPAGIVLLLLVWLVGLGAIVMLWRRDSTTYFAASRAR